MSLHTFLPAAKLTRHQPTPRRIGLKRKMLLLAVLPVLAVGALIALILTAQRAAAVNAVADGLASSVARILATTLDVQDLSLVNAQLRAAVSSESVAFVDVRPGGSDLRFFTSKSPESDWQLQGAYDRFLSAQPGNRHFRYTDDRAAAYQRTLAQLGPDARPDVRAHLEAAIAQTAASGGQVSDYQVTQVQVFEMPGGTRRLRFVDQPEVPGQLLFTLGIGVANTELGGLLNRQLQLVLLVCALVAAVAAGLAYRAAQRLVRPILGVTQAAGRLSLGDLDTPVQVQSNDETSELAQSVERLRVSLQLALSRLRPGREG